MTYQEFKQTIIQLIKIRKGYNLLNQHYTIEQHLDIINDLVQNDFNTKIKYTSFLIPNYQELEINNYFNPYVGIVKPVEYEKYIFYTYYIVLQNNVLDIELIREIHISNYNKWSNNRNDYKSPDDFYFLR